MKSVNSSERESLVELVLRIKYVNKSRELQLFRSALQSAITESLKVSHFLTGLVE